MNYKCFYKSCNNTLARSPKIIFTAHSLIFLNDLKLHQLNYLLIDFLEFLEFSYCVLELEETPKSNLYGNEMKIGGGIIEHH